MLKGKYISIPFNEFFENNGSMFHRFLTTFGEKWGKNEYIMLLLNAITLFSPFRTNLQDIQKLQKIRQRYCDVLRRYNLRPQIFINPSFFLLTSSELWIK